MGPCSVTSIIISYRWIYFVIPMIFPFWLVHSYYFYIPMKFSLHSHTFPKNTFPLYIYICIFPSYSIIFPLCFHCIPIILCPLYYVISMILSIPTILQLCMTYIYTHIFPFDCHDIPILYPIISYYIYISSTHYIIELLVSLCSKHIPMIYPRFSPFQGP